MHSNQGVFTKQLWRESRLLNKFHKLFGSSVWRTELDITNCRLNVGQRSPDSWPIVGLRNCSSQLLTSNQTFRPKSGGFNVIECFHMTSRRPYWCPKTIKRRPCWCSKPILWELNSFLMQTLSFVSINLHRCWPRELKSSIHCILGIGAILRCGTLSC